MARIVCVTGTFPVRDRRGFKIGEEFVVSHGIDMLTQKLVILPSEHPENLGARFDLTLAEWVLEDA